MATSPLAKSIVPVNELGDPTARVNELGDPYPVSQAASVAVMPSPGQQQIQNDQQQLQKVRMSQARPWGFSGSGPTAEFPNGLAPNHPGTMGKIAHVLSVAGNIAGDIFAPATMQNIPGSQLNMQDKEGFLANRLNTDITDESQNQSRDASTANIQSETDERPGNDLSRRNMEHAQADNLESEVSARQEPNLANAYSHAVNQAIKEGRDPATDPIVAHLSDAIVALQPGQNKVPEAPKTTDIVGPDSKVHTMGFNAGTGKYDTDEGLSGFKPNVTHINMGADRAAKNDIIKAYQPTLDSAERLNVMTESYEKAVKDHDQQAMLNLLANHLGMTMGLQKGARLTKDIINEAKQSQPWLAGLQSKFDKDGYLSGVTLSPNQMRQMVALGQERYTEDVKKSRATSQYMGATDDGPQRIPGPATVRFYTGKANGDPARAKALAAADGWSVQ